MQNPPPQKRGVISIIGSPPQGPRSFGRQRHHAKNNHFRSAWKRKKFEAWSGKHWRLVGNFEDSYPKGKPR